MTAEHPPVVSRSVGSYVVHAVVDVAGPIGTLGAEAFPDAMVEQWEAARLLDVSSSGPDEPWRLPFRAFVVVAPDDELTIVDLGVGAEGSVAGAWAPGAGRLPVALSGLGVEPADVFRVVLTHLHEDHVGWVVGSDGRPLFANAEHVVQRTEVAAIAEDREIRRVTVDPLTEAGLLREVDGVTLLTDDVVAEPTPGHTPGHQSVWLTSDDETLLLTGDVLVHAVQLVAPEVAYAAEDDPVVAAATRRRVYDEARRRGAPLGTAHLGAPWIDPPDVMRSEA
jgi:glyoxylase-like metal-dependent hydrolase (beta-lactamase superfamily II)